MSTGTDWRQVLTRRSFIEYDARARAHALVDGGSGREVCDPFDHLESPWLEPQGMVPQADDGVVVLRGTIDGARVVVVSIEQGFLGGGIGEVSGAKISQALLLAAADCRAGVPTAAVLLLETGGVRLHEANLGLNAVAEICSAVLELRELAPVIGVVAGQVGCFGGLGIVAGLCTRLIMTPQGRLGLNGPAVIEQEAGPAEFDASDRPLIWAVHGGAQRHAIGQADTLVPDDADALRRAVTAAVAAGVTDPGQHRSERLDVLAACVDALDPAHPPTPFELRALFERAGTHDHPGPRQRRVDVGGPSRGLAWLAALGGEPTPVIPSVVRADTPDAVYLAVVPDPSAPFHRARGGEVGLAECVALARTVRDIVSEDARTGHRRAVVAVVDLPSQAYGRIEEMAGLHQAIAAAVDACASARRDGHPVVTLVVGRALSGGFLAHGLQAQRILALDDPGVEIHAMHQAAAARVTLRSVEELAELAQKILPLSYRVRDWARLGFCDGLLPVRNADNPTPEDVASVRHAVARAIEDARTGAGDLSGRLDSAAAVTARAASRRVRDRMAAQWRA
ncbi:biotin-independent malonate decarboxylase subunit beta [Streptomyces griseiscabiei]|uniref:Biotin-independent malonate decarboxylase subunit beta n=1 Tax=Streptomyces griseiscabiei TaxID=2993540 RepID=A0ABU4LM50_9ACTN|nr:biotin-independent malonate decarboxylase subunit beta [Streptomyces griseiscabiei]MBZ3900363.1 biotin-independent malonate decarboxylase subunit beta [Streptomyces griseiscabiei]MDX2916305.1 biotin-independent malonate decarboxylase subunit beta [Streptomyces griseiscabiei]